MKTTALVLTAALFALVLPLAMSAQDKAGAPETSITGCFNKGAAEGSYVITDDKTNKKITVSGDAGMLAPHANNHKVTISGTMTKEKNESIGKIKPLFTRAHRRLPAPRPCPHWELSPAAPARQRLGRARWTARQAVRRPRRTPRRAAKAQAWACLLQGADWCKRLGRLQPSGTRRGAAEAFCCGRAARGQDKRCGTRAAAGRTGGGEQDAGPSALTTHRRCERGPQTEDQTRAVGTHDPT